MAKKAMLVAWHNSSAESMAPLYGRLSKTERWELTLVGYHPAITGPDGKEGVFDKRGFPYIKIADNPEGVTSRRMEEIVNYIKPDIVVGGTSPPGSRGLNYAGPEQLAFDVAKRRGIPSVSVIDYWLVQNRYDSGEKNGRFIFLPKIICALDESNSKREMVEQGIPEEIIRVSGNPQHDHLYGLKSEWGTDKTKSAREEMGVPLEHIDKYLVVLFSSVRDDMLDRDKEGYWDLQVTDAVMRGIKGLPELRKDEIFLLMRNHPGEEKQALQTLEALAISYSSPRSEGGYGLPVVFREAGTHKLSFHPDEMTLAADLSIAPRSNLLTAGTLMDRDCISLQPERDSETAGPDPLITNILGLTPHAYSTKKAIEIVRDAITDPDRFFGPYRKRRKVSGFKVNGRATERVVAVMEELV